MGRILVIDDNALFRAMTRRALGDAGHVVREAANGSIALQMLSDDPADVVITDILMPDQDGIETIMALRRLSRPPKILAVSGGGDWMGTLDVLHFARNLGADDVLRKPFRTPELIERVARLLDAQAPSQSSAD